MDGSSILAPGLVRHRNAARECGPYRRGPSGSGLGDPAPLSPRSFLYSRRHRDFPIRGDERERGSKVRKRRDATRSQDRVGQLEERIGALVEGCMESRAEDSQTCHLRVFFCHRLLARIFTFGSLRGGASSSPRLALLPRLIY